MISADPSSVRQLLDRQAIVDVLTHYSRCLDANDIERLVTEVYTPDGVDNHGEGDVTGSDALRDWFEEVRSNFLGCAHNITNIMVAIDGDTATARSNLTAWIWTKAKHDGNPLRSADYVIVLAYVDELRRTGGGWRITRRDLEPNRESIMGAGELPRTQKGSHALADRLRTA